MSKQNNCIDFYGEKLTIGDEVIPILEEALIIGIEGVISKIKYNAEYDNYYITITDKEGNVLLENVDARSYTTKERFNERETQKYVYMLTFYDAELEQLTTIPLTNKTDPNYEIPDETCFAILEAKHLETKDKYKNSSLYHFIVDGYFELCIAKKEGILFLSTLEGHIMHPINVHHRNFKNEDELKKYIKGIIEYFNNADLTHVNNDEVFAKNEKGKEFEKLLIHHLKQ